jgi:hypothetical protein
MATSPVPLWAQEMSPHHRGPTGAGVLRLALVVVLVVLVLQVVATTHSEQLAGDTDHGSLCDQHRADPTWQAVCREQDRGR